MEVWIGADLVEGAAQEHLIRGDAAQIERARRHQEDPVGGTGQVVLAVSAVLHVRVHGLAGLLEVEHRVADLLDLRPVRGFEAGGFEQERRHARVDLGLAQVVHDPADRDRLRPAQVADDVCGRDLGQIATDLEHERRVGRHGRLAADGQIEEQEPRHRDEQREAQDGEDDGESSAGHGGLSCEYLPILARARAEQDFPAISSVSWLMSRRDCARADRPDGARSAILKRSLPPVGPAGHHSRKWRNGRRASLRS